MKHSVCFISETVRHDRPRLDPSVRYRCFHPAEQLLAAGHLVTIQSAEQFFAAPAYDYDAYVFHRPNGSRPGFAQTLDRLRGMNRVVIADYDDLVFGDAETAGQLAAVRTGRTPVDVAAAAFAANLAALQRFDRVSVSTGPLWLAVARYLPAAQIRITANFVPRSLREALAGTGLAYRARSPGRIGYFAGTGNHHRDLAQVGGVLHRVLTEDPRTSLLVTGPVTLPPALAVLPNVQLAQTVDYAHLPHRMALCSTVIAPLEDTLFNACKSRVKFLEAALAGCRLVASPIPDMQIIGAGHLDVATNPDEWYDALSAPPEPAEAMATRRQRNLDYIDDHANTSGLAELIGA